MKSKFLTVIGIVVLMLSFTSCSKEEADPNIVLNDKLVGSSWNVRSFTADGVETMTVLYNTIEITFTKEDPSNGSTKWRLINTIGQATNLDYKYNIRNQGREIQVGTDLFDISVDGNKLSLIGTVAGERWIIDARK